MGIAAYNRGNRVISNQIERDLNTPEARARADRDAERNWVDRLTKQLHALRAENRKARRSVKALRAALTTERLDRAEERARDRLALRYALGWAVRAQAGWDACSRIIRAGMPPREFAEVESGTWESE